MAGDTAVPPHHLVGTHGTADLLTPFAPDLPVTRADAEQNRDALWLAPIRGAAYALPGRDHLFYLGCRHNVGVRTETPLGLVDRVEVRETGRQNDGARGHFIAIGKRSGKVTGLAFELTDYALLMIAAGQEDVEIALEVLVVDNDPQRSAGASARTAASIAAVTSAG